MLYIKLSNSDEQAIIDDDAAAQLVLRFRWTLGPQGYATTTIGSKLVYLHRLVLGSAPEGRMVVDHINGERLDNRLANLRWVTLLQNCWNRKTRFDNKSGQQGVHYYAKKKHWVARIQVDRKKIHLGQFKDKDEALMIREAAEAILLGEYRRH